MTPPRCTALTKLAERFLATTHMAPFHSEENPSDMLGHPPPSPRPPAHKMTPLQNDPQPPQREPKHRTFRVSRGSEWSPDSESARRELSNSGLASNSGPQKYDCVSNSDGGTTTGAPRWTRVRSRRNQCTTETFSRTPYRLRCLGKHTNKNK
jgi:hypothetical protein